MTEIFDIPGYEDFVQIVPINKGYSTDEKIYIRSFEGLEYLIRISDIKEREQKEKEFEMMKKAALLGIPMQEPIAFGICNNKKSVYMKLTWVNGEDANDVLPKLSNSEALILGIKSGEIIKKIHSIAAPTSLESWEKRYTRKTDYRIKKYRMYRNSFPASHNEDSFISYIEQNIAALKDRPQCFLHGDYHSGNMIVREKGGYSGIDIIDWNRFDFGDPYEEFNRLTFSARVNKYFATGQLYRYFVGEPPIEFFTLLALYISSNQLGALAFAYENDKNDIDFTLEQNEVILGWYDNMNTVIPSWFKKI